MIVPLEEVWDEPQMGLWALKSPNRSIGDGSWEIKESRALDERDKDGGK